jgi:hypothetical protein
MKRIKLIITTFILIFVLVSLIYWGRLNYFEETKHSSDLWTTIEDSKGNLISIDFQNTDNNIWDTLVKLNRNGTKIFIGGIIEQYQNKWGFHFKINSIEILRSVTEDRQANIEQISSDLNHWENGQVVYIYSTVVETHILVPIS